MLPKAQDQSPRRGDSGCLLEHAMQLQTIRPDGPSTAARTSGRVCSVVTPSSSPQHEPANESVLPRGDHHATIARTGPPTLSPTATVTQHVRPDRGNPAPPRHCAVRFLQHWRAQHPSPRLLECEYRHKRRLSLRFSSSRPASGTALEALTSTRRRPQSRHEPDEPGGWCTCQGVPSRAAHLTIPSPAPTLTHRHAFDNHAPEHRTPPADAL
jgi:hypothetical protein